MKKININIPIVPMPQARPRFTRRGHAYKAEKSRKYEKEIADYYKQCTKGFMFDPEQPLVINIGFGIPIPKSVSKRKAEEMAEGKIQPTKNRGDIDNLTKAVLDALNGVAYKDDKQIVRITAFKEYSKHPYVYIYMYESVD